MKVLLLSALVVGASGAWVVQGWRYDSKVATIEKQCAADIGTLKSTLETRNAQLLNSHLTSNLKAQENANIESRKNSRVSASNRVVAASLRCPATTATGTLEGGSQGTAVTSVASASTTAQPDVLGACAASIAVLADWCTGHVNDIRMIQDSVLVSD
jgi:hypothetical protein